MSMPEINSPYPREWSGDDLEKFMKSSTAKLDIVRDLGVYECTVNTAKGERKFEFSVNDIFKLIDNAYDKQGANKEVLKKIFTIISRNKDSIPGDALELHGKIQAKFASVVLGNYEGISNARSQAEKDVKIHDKRKQKVREGQLRIIEGAPIKSSEISTTQIEGLTPEAEKLLDALAKARPLRGTNSFSIPLGRGLFKSSSTMTLGEIKKYYNEKMKNLPPENQLLLSLKLVKFEVLNGPGNLKAKEAIVKDFISNSPEGIQMPKAYIDELNAALSLNRRSFEI